MFAETPLSAIPQIQLVPRVSRSEAAVSKRLVRMVPGSARNWIAVNAVQQIKSQQKLKTKNMTTPQLRNSIDRSPLRLGFFLIMIALASFALSHTARAQLPSPAPDGGYPGNNTPEGDGALCSLTSGLNNTAMGFQALFSNTTGNQNTANGNNALQNT